VNKLHRAQSFYIRFILRRRPHNATLNAAIFNRSIFTAAFILFYFTCADGGCMLQKMHYNKSENTT